MFRDRLRALREQAGLSQSELAARLNVHPVCISNWEVGKRRPSVDDLDEIAQALNVPTEFLTVDQDDLIARVLGYLNDVAKKQIALHDSGMKADGYRGNPQPYPFPLEFLLEREDSREPVALGNH